MSNQTDRATILNDLDFMYKAIQSHLEVYMKVAPEDTNLFQALHCGTVSALGAIRQYKEREKL